MINKLFGRAKLFTINILLSTQYYASQLTEIMRSINRYLLVICGSRETPIINCIKAILSIEYYINCYFYLRNFALRKFALLFCFYI